MFSIEAVGIAGTTQFGQEIFFKLVNLQALLTGKLVPTPELDVSKGAYEVRRFVNTPLPIESIKRRSRIDETTASAVDLTKSWSSC